MSVHPTTNTRSRAFAIAGSIIASLAFAGVASADEPALVGGNANCASLGGNYFEVKVDNVRDGRTVFADDGLSGEVVAKGLYLDWSATPGIDAVIVKGGSSSNVYRADDEMTSGTGLHAPINPDNGRPYGLSHVSFCSDGIDSPSRAAQPSPEDANAPCTMADGSPCGAPAAQPGSTPESGAVLGARARGRVSAAGAQMRAPSTCVSKSYVQLLRGKGIRKVTMSVNGKTLRTFSSARSRYAVTIDPTDYPNGVMRLKARVVFAASSGKRPQTFRMTVLRCAKAAVDQNLAFAG